MFDEGDELPVRRNADSAHPARALVEHLADGVFEPASAADDAANSQRLPVWRPVRVLDALEDLAGRPAGQRYPGKRSRRFIPDDISAAEGDRELSRGRDRKDNRARKRQRPGLGDVGPGREQLHGAAFPGGAVHDGLAVRGEAGGCDPAPLKRQTPEFDRRGRLAGEATPNEEPEAAPDQKGDEGGEEPAAAPCFGWPDRRLHSARGGSLRQMVAHPLELAREVLRRRVALIRVLGEAPLDDPANGGRSLRRGLLEGLRLLTDDRDEGLGPRLSLERPPACGHLVEDRAQGELVGTKVDGLTAGLLGRHVTDRPHHRSRDRPGGHCRRQDGTLLHRRLRQLRQPEVQDLGEAVLRDHHVLGLQVAVHDAGRVGFRKTLGDLDSEVEQPLGGKRLARGDQLAQGPALDHLHRDVGGPVGLTDVVDRQDVGMVESRGGARLLLEALAAVGVGGGGLRQDLDRDVAAEFGVPRAIDLAHPARAQRREDLVRAEAGAGRQAHALSAFPSPGRARRARAGRNRHRTRRLARS